MAPRKPHGQAGGPTQGGTRTGPPGAGSADAQSRPRGGSADRGTLQTSVSIASHIEVIGVKRPSYGKEGHLIKTLANVGEASIPEGMIHQYDVRIFVGDDDKEKTLSTSFNRSLFNKMQDSFQDIFTPHTIYDGRKLAFTSHALDLGMSDKCQFDLMTDNGPEQPPKRFIICLTKLSVINLEVLQCFIKGLQSYDNDMQKAFTALNVVIRMAPSLKYPSQCQSIYMHQTKSIGLGLSICQGYFHSVCPSINHLLMDVDIMMGIMYKDGPLILLCLEYLGLHPNQVHQLNLEQGLSMDERIHLQWFFSEMKVVPVLAASGVHEEKGKSVLVKRLIDRNALMLIFTSYGGGVTTTVAAYFQQKNQLLQYSYVMCIEIFSRAFVSLEMSEVLFGQYAKKEIPPEVMAAIVAFSTKPFIEQLAAIKDDIQLLQYNNSEYVKAFGLNIKSDLLLFKINAHVLIPTMLQFGRKTVLILLAACQDAGEILKFTFITVIKGYYIRVFSENPKDINKNSKNLIVETIVDQDINSSVLFNWYLESYWGLKGTNQSGYYTVLHDGSDFILYALKSLAFLLYHTFARTIKSVSILAPVYYAHLICDIAKQHYDSLCPVISDTRTFDLTEYNHIMKQHKNDYKAKVHSNQKNKIY